MNPETTNKLVLVTATIFGFYFALVGIWSQNKIVGVPAFIILNNIDLFRIQEE